LAQALKRRKYISGNFTVNKLRSIAEVRNVDPYPQAFSTSERKSKIKQNKAKSRHIILRVRLQARHIL
jgi:hypothetical protein